MMCEQCRMASSSSVPPKECYSLAETARLLHVHVSESESPPFPLTHRVPFRHDAVNGERGHGMGHPSPRHSAEFKQQAVRLYRERGGTCAETAREPGVDPGSLPDWVRRADAAQAPAGDNPFQTAEDLRRLRRESERLKRENEMLLRASAFLAGG